MAELKYKEYVATDVGMLEVFDDNFRRGGANEFLPFCEGLSYVQIADKIVPDRNGYFAAPIYLISTIHDITIGVQTLQQKVEEYLSREKDEHNDIDVLSISSEIKDDDIALTVLVRYYGQGDYNFKGFFDYMGENTFRDDAEDKANTGNLVVPEEIKNFNFTDEEKHSHKIALEEQNKILEESSKEQPFLNSIDEYVPKRLMHPGEFTDYIYDLEANDKKLKTRTSYEKFTEVFHKIMDYVNTINIYDYQNVLRGEASEDAFIDTLETYARSFFVEAGELYEEDLPAMRKKLHRSLFKMYILQDLVDDPNVSDIIITSPFSIRCKVFGKTYLSNITFMDEADYNRFIEFLATKNGLYFDRPTQTFTDSSDDDYNLRITISNAYINNVPWPTMHIGKTSKHKYLGDDLVKLGMMPEKVRQYILDQGRDKTNGGVVFAGPPRSGKTVCMNWFLEESYEADANILCIQENDELYSYRSNARFQHVVNYPRDGEEPVDLEELGRLALVAGADVFIIGEAKGPEICSAITLANSGCRTAITIHSNSASETIEKMADLALRGYAQTYNQAKRSLKCFRTIVYLRDFKVQEIVEILGYDDKKQDMIFRQIYRRPENEEE